MFFSSKKNKFRIECMALKTETLYHTKRSITIGAKTNCLLFIGSYKGMFFDTKLEKKTIHRHYNKKFARGWFSERYHGYFNCRPSIMMG